MTTKTTTPNRWGRAAALAGLAGCFVFLGCGRGLLGISSTERHDAGGQDTAGAVPAGLSVCFADHPASCDATCREATRVLYTNCAECHSGPTPYGLPPWDFLFDAQKLTTYLWSREGLPPISFARPGDPENSAIYLRAVIRKDMPPIYLDWSLPTQPRVTAADGQILHDWIAGCLGPGPGPIDAGDSDGSGIITRDADESDGSTFPPDAPISDAIITRDAGESDGSAFPPDAPKSEAIIRSQDADEGLPDAFR